MLTTARLRLRPMEPEDAGALFRYRSGREANIFQSWIPDTVEDALTFIESLPGEVNKTGTWYQLAIAEQEIGDLIGDLGLHFLDNHQVELGITLAAWHQGKGYATEAIRGALDYLFGTLNKHRVTASIAPANTRSLALFERAGFRKEAHFRKSLFFKGIWVDDVVYGILREEWVNA